MTHRDELLSIQARVDAQQRELDEAKSEIALLRAAHAQKTREAEVLRRELDEHRGGVRAAHEKSDATKLDAAEHDVEGLRWSMRLGASIMAGVALVGSMMLAVGASRGACHGGARAYAATSTAVTPLVRDGHVVATHGPEVVATGEQCTVERMPVEGGGFDCRVEVRCGGETLYGTTFDTGYVRCGGREVVRDADVTARDGDPAMTMDLARGRVIVEERVGLGTQRVEIALDPIVD
ncbi:hypothetical protein [Sandaracinus amylolyticus]|uniref:hypothetical protein n=1 Tax=Sandaracinus amylolyticus TaxID=927083 RepID=UPI0012EEBCA7|nr:hypothetical protein [Sandaracinus amylolyticus]